MTARIINLRQRRKQKQREGARKTADGNAAKFGRTRAERNVQDAQKTAEVRHLDGHRLDREADSDGDG